MSSPIRIGSGSIILVPDARQFQRRANEDLKKVMLSANVLLAPNLPRGFRKDAQTKVDAIRLTGNVHLSPKLADGFREDARAKIEAALGAMRHEIALGVRVETATASAQMEAWRSRQERPLRIRVETVGEGGRRGASARGSRGVREEAPAFSASGVTHDGVRVRLAANSAADLRRQIESIGGLRASVTPRLAGNAARDMQHDMDRMANSLRFQPRVAGLDLRLPLGGAFGLTLLPEMITQLGGLAAAIQQVGQAGLALPGMFAAAGASLATVLVGVSGLKAAYKALSTQEQDSATTASSQASARREVRNAVQDETHARRELADAITNEQRRQRDLALQLRGGKLAEAGAILEIQEAAQKLRTGGFSSRMEYDQGVLDYEEKVQNLLEVRNRNADLAQDVAKNEKTGVANSDAVLNATQALTSATERIADATQKMAEGSSALSTASAKAQAALDKLSPSAQQFIKNLIALRPEFHRFAYGVQEDLTGGLTPAFNNLFHSDTIQKNLHGDMQRLAGALNAQVKTVLAQLQTPQTGSLLDRIFGSTTDATKRFTGGGVKPMIDSIMKLGAAGTEELPRISEAMNVVIGRFDAFVSKADKDGSLRRWMDQGLDAFTQIGRIIQNIGTSFSGLNRAFGGSFLKDVDDVTKRISNFLNSGRGQNDMEKLIVDTRDAMAQWKPILEDLIPVLKTAFDTGRTYVSGMLGPLDLLLKALSSSPQLITTVMTAFLSWKVISTVLGPIKGALNGLQGYLGSVAGNLENSSGAMGRMGGAAKTLESKIGTLAGAFAVGSPLVVALTVVAMAAFNTYLDKQHAVQEQTQQLIQQQNEFADALDRTSGMITEQNRDDIARKLADYKPIHGTSLTSHVFSDAAALGIGGANGADLVTATMPGGDAQYSQIMGKLREQVRPTVRDFLSKNHIDLSAEGISEDDVVNAYLGDPLAVAKFDAAKQRALHDRGSKDPLTQVNLGMLDQLVIGVGGDTRKAAGVGQALSGVRQTTGAASPNSPVNQARRAANPQVGLPPNSIFGNGSAFAGNGEYKIVTKTPPTDRNMAALLKNSNGAVTVTATVPGAVDSNGNPFSGFEYTLPHDLAQKYMTGVPQYHTGGPTQAGLGNLLDDEFVIKDRGRFPSGTLDAINDGKINPHDLPHMVGGGPAPIPLEPAPMPAPGGSGGPGDAPPVAAAPPPPPPPTPPVPGELAPSPGGTDNLPPTGPFLPGPATQGGVTGPTPFPTGANVPGSGGIDLSGAPTIPGLPPMPAGAGDLSGQIPPIPGAGINGLIFGAQGAPAGAGGAAGNIGQGFLSSFLGGGGGAGGGIGGMLSQISGKFGQILMQGLLGFFGIDPQYLNDLGRLIPGLTKAFGGGFTDPAAQSAVEGNILAYASDGSPIYYTPGSPGTALPDAGSTGTGGAGASSGTGAPVNIPGIGNFSNIAFPKADKTTYTIDSSDPRYTALSSLGLSPLFQNPDKGNPAIPDWVQTFVRTYGGKSLTAASSPHGSLHGNSGGPGFAVDVTGDPADMDALGTYLLANPSLSAQMIHQTAAGAPQGVAGGAAVPTGTYYTTAGGTYADEGPMVHWAPSIRPTDAAGQVIDTAPSPAASSATPTPTLTTPPATSPGPQVQGPGATAASPLPPDMTPGSTGEAAGQLPPATISPPSSSSTPANAGPTTDPNDGKLVVAEDDKGRQYLETGIVAKARGHKIKRVATQADINAEAGVGSVGGAGGASDTAGGDIQLPGPGLPLLGGAGKGLPGRGFLWSPTKGVIGTSMPGAAQASGALDATAGTNIGSMDLKARAHAMYLAAGMPPGEWGSFDQLLSHESGWRPTAQNPGSTAHGLGQFLNSTWGSVGGVKTDDADTQLRYIFQYLRQRPDYHGSPAAAWTLWQQRHWYAGGGSVLPMGGPFITPTIDGQGSGSGGFGLNAPGSPYASVPSGILKAIGESSKPHGPTPGYASGSYINQGSGRKDDVLAMLKRGEFVQNDKSVDTYGLPFHTALNARMINPKAVKALMSGGMPHFAEGGTLGQQPTPNDLQAIQAQLAGSAITPPAPPARSGVSIQQIPDIAQMAPPPPRAPTVPLPPTPAPPPQPGQPTTPPPPAPLEPEAGVPVQPVIAAAPSSTDHELPALKTGITSTAATLGNLAAMAASAAGAIAPGAGAASGLIAGAFAQGGKIANSIANVVSSALVGTVTPGTTANPYGQRVKGNQAPNTLMPIDNSTHYHGDLYSNDMDDFFRRQDLRDSVQMQSQLAAAPGY